MHLKRLEISGFKSFAKKSELQFTSPVTAIVGPNGSGKSNVVESIRFVLGEQSMKSLRGKLGADLIFKGSKNLGKLNRAFVTIVFDNRERIFSLPSGANESLKMDYDEISISREVFSDGVNHYSVNGTEVRLKDVLEMLASVNIGSSGHHIISQGEADRILNAKATDRRAMIEDALGLKVYQYRLKESERKLDKTKENIKEVESLRREIAPHLNFLKKQVEKFQKAEEMRKDLDGMYREYLKKEEVYIEKEKGNIHAEKTDLNVKLSEINAVLEKENKGIAAPKGAKQIELEEIENKIRQMSGIKDELSRKLGRVEGMLELEERRQENQKKSEQTLQTGSGQAKSSATISVSVKEMEDFVADLNAHIDEAIAKKEVAEIIPFLEKIKNLVSHFLPSRIRQPADGKAENAAPYNTEEIEKMRQTKDGILAEIHELGDEEKNLYEKARLAKSEIEKEKEAERKEDHFRFELTMKKNELNGALNMLRIKEENFLKVDADFKEEIREGSVLVGNAVFAYKDFSIPRADIEEPRFAQEERRKKIERIKIKLEDAGVGGGDDVLKEFNETNERNAFLAKEVEDLAKSMESLEALIKDLKEKLDIEFKVGLEKINAQFEIFFDLMFGGGHAHLSVSLPPKKKSKDEDDEDEEVAFEEPEEEFEQGIDINVSLPQKKVKDLNMLSGGERSLTSIALLFAVSQVNPPPFLVLDETDAALDEANSRKYGDMIENLSKYSQLIVITHNRETMSRANVLYGVTIGSDGASKLLSIKFDEAVAIAK